MQVGGFNNGADWDFILLQHDAFQAGNVITLLESLLPPSVELGLALKLEAAGSFKMSVTTYQLHNSIIS